MEGKKPSNLQILYRHYKTSSLILRQILKNPISREEGIRVLKERLAAREDNFLQILEKAIFANPNSPYRV